MGKRDLVWCEPPSHGGHRKSETVELLADLDAVRERPGEWCRLRVFKSLNGAGMARNRLVKLNGAVAGFRFATRRVEGNHSGLWAIYEVDA